MAEIQITVTGDGRDAKGRRIAHCICPACGQPFSARWDHVKSGRTKRCPACRGVGPRVDAQAPPIAAPAIPAPAEINEGELTPPNPHKMLTPDWYRYEIASCDTTLRVLLDQAGQLVRKMEEEGGIAPSGMDGKSADELFAKNVRTVTNLRKSKRALEQELYVLESPKQKAMTPLQAVAARAAGIPRGRKQ